MVQKIKNAIQLISNMGWRYVIFRTSFEIEKRSGLLKKKFPLAPGKKAHYTLNSWREKANPFFFESKEMLSFQQVLSSDLEYGFKQLSDFKYPFFSNQEFELGPDFDWMTNPDSGFKYNADLHWLDINDFDKQAGDIKYVWEPSRFSHLYTIIRYDKSSGFDCSKQVFSEIQSWLTANKINQGPNFKCSQEISLRTLNWIFALYYYKNSPNLTQELFDEIQHYIFWQVEHVYENINFSRIAVRNNHAITETLTLYLVGLLFPDYPRAKKWKNQGKKWFEQEIAYQVYEDGTFLQFSMNYHRVVIQLLTWAIRLSELNNEKFSDVVYDRAEKSLKFLVNAMNENDGWLPNYGNNDGALFFKLSNAHYRDYRPQLEALAHTLKLEWNYKSFEDTQWYGTVSNQNKPSIQIEQGYIPYHIGGFYMCRQNKSLTFLRCGNHKDRPAQADNLHLDVWVNGENILHDAGTYKYNSTDKDLKYFMGTQSHNTVMLDDHDQMEKGARFIWYYWTQCVEVERNETPDYFIIRGVIKAFQQLNSNILHEREIKVFKNETKWEITDTIHNKPKHMQLKQMWHTRYPEMLKITCIDPVKERIDPKLIDGYYANYYGKKEICSDMIFSTSEDSLKTIITIN